MTGENGAGAGNSRDDDRPDGDIRLVDIDRIFSIIEEVLRMEAIDDQQTNQLLRVLEQLVASPMETDPDLITEFVALLERFIVEPDGLDGANVDGILGIFEQALAGVANDDTRTEDVLSVLEAAVRDPASVDPEDVEQFRSGLEGAITEITDPYSGPFAQLFGFSGSPTADAEILEDEQLDLFRLARLGAGMTQRATGYSLETGVRSGTRLAYAAMNASSPAELLTETRAVTLDELQRSGINLGDEQTDWLAAHQEELVDSRPITREALRERGERLLSKSAELGRDEAFHPAYPSILDSLSADEARILRLFATTGIQACIDVYDRRYIPFSLTLVARNLSTVGNDAGCRHPERTPIYLQNLERLGLIRFSDEPVEDLKRYQVLDAQPHIEAAIEKAKRPKTVYGSIQLTELGIDFCEICLPVAVDHRTQRRRFRGEKPAKTDGDSE